MKACISAAAAARVLGIPPIVIKQNLRRGIWDFGEIIPKEKTGAKKDRIIILVPKLEKYIGRGITEDEIKA